MLPAVWAQMVPREQKTSSSVTAAFRTIVCIEIPSLKLSAQKR
jgi:hypothetical protein